MSDLRYRAIPGAFFDLARIYNHGECLLSRSWVATQEAAVIDWQGPRHCREPLRLRSDNLTESVKAFEAQRPNTPRHFEASSETDPILPCDHMTGEMF